MNKEQQEALAARHKEDAALQKKLDEQHKKDSDAYDKAVGKTSEEPVEPKGGKAADKSEEGK